MLYAECIDYLNSLGGAIPVAKSGLDNMRAILHALGQPQRRYPSVLIAGTNGKGSVATFLSSILVSAGLHTGLYTSPHLVSPDERIAVDGRKVTREGFANCVSRTAEAIRTLSLPCHPAFFETLTSAALLHFAEAHVGIAVVEAGMGGRTDSTNIVEPVLSVITPVSIDHQQYLGRSLEEIAYQKAGIIHRHGTAISAPQRPEVAAILEQEATDQEVVLSYANEAGAVITDCTDGRYRFSFRDQSFEPALLGRHQVGNAVLALCAAGILAEMGYPIPPAALIEGVNRAFIPGRIQRIGDNPAVFVDGAHNDEALAKLVDFVCEHTRRPRALVFALMADKHLFSSPGRLEQCFDAIYLTRPSCKRAATREQLLSRFPEGIWIDSPFEAVKIARRRVETVVITGSLYLVGEILGSGSGPDRQEDY
ncbi:MAG: folylpolyglutamate synthase/dihydrofolate synthase family protein [Acidobacteriota bacterium]